MQSTRQLDSLAEGRNEPPLPSISIIVPTYERRDVVCDVVRALCEVDYAAPVEIIVVVDGSSDGTAAALAGLECRSPLRIIEQDNYGAAAMSSCSSTTT
jgi:glycosyltransferase involved in cell wall biosynthesis